MATSRAAMCSSSITTASSEKNKGHTKCELEGGGLPIGGVGVWALGFSLASAPGRGRGGGGFGTRGLLLLSLFWGYVVHCRHQPPPSGRSAARLPPVMPTLHTHTPATAPLSLEFMHAHKNTTHALVCDCARLLRFPSSTPRHAHRVSDFGLIAVRESQSGYGGGDTMPSAAWTAPEVLDDQDPSVLSDVYRYNVVGNSRRGVKRRRFVY